MDVRKIVISANYGGFDTPQPPEDDIDYHLFTERNYPLRDKAMTPRLQARMIKCFGWQLVPDYQYYIWCDSSIQLTKGAIEWLMGYAKHAEFTILKHPTRDTIGQEAEYIKERVANGDKYLTPRYEHELIDEQMEAIGDDSLPLYASTVFVYRPTYYVKLIMKEWWYHITRYHIVDQLGLSYCLHKMPYPPVFNVIPDSLYTTKYFRHVR